jgi:hypothetical protein
MGSTLVTNIKFADVEAGTRNVASKAAGCKGDMQSGRRGCRQLSGKAAIKKLSAALFQRMAREVK